MNNLLIGGSGFIGSALGTSLLARNESVVSLSLSKEGNAQGVDSVILDLYRESCPPALFNNVSRVFILLGQIHKGFDPEQEKKIVRDLSCLLAQNQTKVYYFSTALVYGNTVKKVNEKNACHPLDAYSQFKLEAEAICKENLRSDQLTILRLSNVYGTTRNKGFIGLLMNKLSDINPEITVNGDGRQSRDFIFVDDIVQAILAVINSSTHSDIINISTGISHTLIEVIELLSEVSGKNINYTLTGVMVQEPQNNQIDNNYLKSTYGYRHFTTLKSGLSQTLKSYQNYSNDTH